MSVGRVLSSLAASVAVTGCAVVAIAMGQAADHQHDAQRSSRPAAEVTARPATPVGPARTTAPPVRSAAAPRASTSAPHRLAISTPSSTPSTPRPVASITAPRPPARPTPAASRATAHRAAATAPAARRPVVHRSTAAPVRHPAVSSGSALPLGFSPGDATRVITVIAASHSSTTAHLQAWQKSGGTWHRYGSAVTAHVGSDGLSRYASESRSATPIGSFTITRAFGHYANPGTSLPYVHTTSADWWISQPGPLYNTMQDCSYNCPFTRGSPNEHLYYETPYYNYAAVIDYNTRNAPGGVHQGAGSAFFLHVTDYRPTAGCVAIPQYRLVPLLRWLRPYTHPRIIIGVS